MAEYELTFQTVSLPAGSGGAEVLVEEDSDIDGTFETSHTVTLSDGVTSYTTADVFAGEGEVKIRIEFGAPSDVSVGSSTVVPATIKSTIQTIAAPVSTAVSATPTPEAGAYVSGTVTSGGAGAEGAVVRAIRQSDGVQLATATADANGDYEMKLEPNQGDVHFTVEWTDGSGEEYRDESYPYLNI